MEWVEKKVEMGELCHTLLCVLPPSVFDVLEAEEGTEEEDQDEGLESKDGPRHH